MILTGSNAALALAAMERVRAAVAARDWGDIAPGLGLWFRSAWPVIARTIPRNS